MFFVERWNGFYLVKLFRTLIVSRQDIRYAKVLMFEPVKSSQISQLRESSVYWQLHFLEAVPLTCSTLHSNCFSLMSCYQCPLKSVFQILLWIYIFDGIISIWQIWYNDEIDWITSNQGFLMLYLENIKRLLIIIFSFRIKIWIVNKIKIWIEFWRGWWK